MLRVRMADAMSGAPGVQALQPSHAANLLPLRRRVQDFSYRPSQSVIPVLYRLYSHCRAQKDERRRT
jgi:hypothetical protein